MLMNVTKSPSRAILYIRSSIYWIVLFFSTVLFSTLLLICFALPITVRYVFAKGWAKTNRIALRWICSLDCKIEGVENITREPVIVFSKHQSVYEIIILLSEMGVMAWVAKRELLWLPIFGWAFALSKPITINRKAGGRAVDQVVRQGCSALNEGRSVLIFPEGTRTAPGARPNYRIGGSILAERSGFPVLPVAHNAGEYWPRNTFLKLPGTVMLSIGPLIRTVDKSAEQINEEAKNWIETKIQQINNSTSRLNN